MPDSSATPAASHSTASTYRRRLPIGAEPIDRERTHVRVWAPRARRVQVVCGGGVTPLDRENDSYHSGTFCGVMGDRYHFKLDDDERLYPDPASRFQPEGVHGPSEIVDPNTFRWTDHAWTGAVLEGQVVYEMHVGTFTPAGTFAAATAELRDRHHLDERDTDPRQFLQFCRRRRPRADARKRAHVHLVEDLAFEAHASPLIVGPAERSRVDDLGRTVGPVRLIPRRRIGQRPIGGIEAELVACARRRGRKTAVVAAGLTGERRRLAGCEHDFDAPRGGRPHSKVSPAGAGVFGADRQPPGRWHA